MAPNADPNSGPENPSEIFTMVDSSSMRVSFTSVHFPFGCFESIHLSASISLYFTDLELSAGVIFH